MHGTHPYDALTPEVILDAVETFGGRCSGALLALNSYENRVYRVMLEDGTPRVAKFYRPQRWSDAAILEEHAFARLLADHEIPAVAPLVHPDGGTLHNHAGFGFALFPWQPGRAPELNAIEDWRTLGRYLGRLHRLGAAAAFQHRPRLSVVAAREAAADLVAGPFIPPELKESFRAIAGYVLGMIDTAFADRPRITWLRAHGDAHLSNILWSETGPHLVDFDDCMMAPAIQDLWMLLSGERADRERQVGDLLDGYAAFADFDPVELGLVEPLRTLRLLRYSAWIAARWDDPAFPRAFPWFTGPRYWEEQILTLRQQAALLSEPPLSWEPP